MTKFKHQCTWVWKLSPAASKEYKSHLHLINKPVQIISRHFLQTTVSTLHWPLLASLSPSLPVLHSFSFEKIQSWYRNWKFVLNGKHSWQNPFSTFPDLEQFGGKSFKNRVYLRTTNDSNYHQIIMSLV